jgi:hypothetical protein
MQKRKYTHLKAVEGLILSMRQDGMTFQEIADELGLSHKQLRNWSYRHNCENRNMLKGITPKPKGRPAIQNTLHKFCVSFAVIHNRTPIGHAFHLLS